MRIFLCLSGLLMGLSLSAADPVAKAASGPAAGEARPISSEEEALLVIKAVPYAPALKRDPFSVPTDVERSSQGDLVDDLGVKGRIVSGGKVMVVVTDSRGNTRSLPVGYRFRDGEIVSITEKAVTFRQWDVNSTNRSVFRTVVKPFKREEGKR